MYEVNIRSGPDIVDDAYICQTLAVGGDQEAIVALGYS